MSHTTFIPDADAAAEAAALIGDLHRRPLPDWFEEHFVPAIESVAASRQIAIFTDAEEPELTPAQVARMLRVSRSKVSRLIADGRLPSRKVRGRHRVAWTDATRHKEACIEQRVADLRALTAAEEGLDSSPERVAKALERVRGTHA